MLLPYSASSARRSIFWALLWVAVLGPAVLVSIGFLPSSAVAPWLALLSLLSGVGAIMFLCVWCSFYVKDEPRLVRIALSWIALLSLSFTIVVVWAAFTPNRGCITTEIRTKADIRGIRTLLLSFNETNGYYPSTDQGLEALVPRFMEEVPRDAWGASHAYRCPGKRHPNAYDLFSAGADRVADTADDEWGK